MVMMGSSKYYAGQYGINSDTNVDSVLIKIDESMATQWASSFDFNSKTDSIFDVYLDSGTLYGTSNFDLKYICFFALNYDNGVLAKSKCFSRNLSLLDIGDSIILADCKLYIVTAYKSFIFVFLNGDVSGIKSYLMWIDKNNFDIWKMYKTSFIKKAQSFIQTDHILSIFMSEVNLYSRIDFDTETLDVSKIIAFSSYADTKFYHKFSILLPVVKNTSASE